MDAKGYILTFHAQMYTLTSTNPFDVSCGKKWGTLVCLQNKSHILKLYGRKYECNALHLFSKTETLFRKVETLQRQRKFTKAHNITIN